MRPVPNLTLRREDGRVVAESVTVADSTMRRLRGLLGKGDLPSGQGILLRPAWSIHTAFMHFPIDVVFIDADKDNYPGYGRWAIEHLRPGGLVIGDNAYLFGELTADTHRGRAMREFHELVAAACESVCIPTPDGLVVGIKR